MPSASSPTSSAVPAGRLSPVTGGGASLGDRTWLWALVLALGVPALNLWIVHGAQPELFDPLITDTDTLMRLVRVRAILDQGWGDGTTALGGVPYSQVLQWTAPLDALLVGLATFLEVAGVERSLEWSAILISPILQGLICVVIVGLAPPALPRQVLVAAILVVILQPAFLIYTSAGRGDHHALLLLLFTLAAVSVARASIESDRRWPWVAGLAIGVGLWVSIEALTWWAAALGAMSLLWLAGDDRMPGAMGRTATMTALVAAAAWQIEAALGFPAIGALDRLSPTWLTALAVAAVVLGGLARVARPEWSAGHRGAALSVAGVTAGALSTGLMPELVRGPFGSVDPETFAVWAGHVREMLPVSDPKSIGLFLAVPAVAAGLALVLAVRRRGMVRIRWLAGAGLIGGFLLLTVLQMRWGSYAGLTAGLLMAPLLASMSPRRDAGQGVTVAALLVGAIALPWGAGQVLGTLESDSVAGAATADACDRPTLIDAVDRLQADRDPPMRVLTAPDHGPAVAFYTGADAALVPAHRLGDRIVALSLAMRSADDSAVNAVLAHHGVDAVALCVGGPARVSFDGGSDSVYRQLVAGMAPPGFVPVATDNDGVRVYRVGERETAD